MIVKKQTSNDVVNQIVSYISEFDKNNRQRIITPKLKGIMHNFTTKVENYAIFIECTEDEVSSLLLDYINMLSAKKHVICLAFIDRQNSIDILKELDQIKNWTESFMVMPTNKVDNKIKVYLSFYNSQYSKKYEVDLAAQLFLY